MIKQNILGIDIGSTSTKAVLLGLNKEVITGFYIATSGQPVQAVQVVFEAIDDYSVSRKPIPSLRWGAGLQIYHFARRHG